jgi:hypothetical protein
MKITIDNRGLEAKLKRLTADLQNKVLVKAANDAATQTRNNAAREIQKTLNLPAAKIKEKLPVKKAFRRGNLTFAEIRGEYQQVGAQNFPGWKYIGKQRGRLLVSTAKVTKFAKSTKGKAGLSVQFYKNRPKMHFGIAFPLRGGSFFQRVKPSTRKSAKAWSLNMPITRIVGPSVHGEFSEQLPKHVAFGRAVFRKRLEYWLGREIRRKYG